MRGEDESGGNKPLSKAEQDRRDLHLETAGLEAGRIKRFLPEGTRPDPSGKRAERKERAFSRLMTLLQSNAAYAALYRETMDRLQRTEAAVETALARRMEILEQADAVLDQARDGANTLPDGTRVYRDADGKARTEDGREVAEDQLDRITWRAGAVSYEELLARKKAAEEARRSLDELRRYQVDVLGHARDRITDEDNPPDEAELDEIKDNIEAEMPEAVRKEVSPSPQPGKTVESAANLKLPDLGS